MTTFTWTIESMLCKPAEGEYTDVVVNASWVCAGEDNGFFATRYNAISFPAPEGSFTPYADLTQEQVLGWVWVNGVDKDATEASVQSSIDQQINPPVVQPPLPWVTPPATGA